MSNPAISGDGRISTERRLAGLLVTVVLITSALSFVAIGGGGYCNAYAQNQNIDNNNGNNNNKNLDVQVIKPSPALIAQWWQWAASFPPDENPLTDTQVNNAARVTLAIVSSF